MGRPLGKSLLGSIPHSTPAFCELTTECLLGPYVEAGGALCKSEPLDGRGNERSVHRHSTNPHFKIHPVHVWLLVPNSSSWTAMEDQWWMRLVIEPHPAPLSFSWVLLPSAQTFAEVSHLSQQTSRSKSLAQLSSTSLASPILHNEGCKLLDFSTVWGRRGSHSGDNLVLTNKPALSTTLFWFKIEFHEVTTFQRSGWKVGFWKDHEIGRMP